MKNGNFVVEKNVSTSQYKKRMVIYDKGAEMALSGNRGFLSEVLSDEETKVDVSDWKSYQMWLVLKDCDYDLQKVEAKMRQHYAKGNNFTKIMNPYRDLLSSSQSSMIRRTLLDRLGMCKS